MFYGNYVNNVGTSACNASQRVLGVDFFRFGYYFREATHSRAAHRPHGSTGQRRTCKYTLTASQQALKAPHPPRVGSVKNK